MCGINFLVTDEDAESAVIKMNNILSHRGKPGRTGTSTHLFHKFSACLGHVRLPIRGLGEQFDQPFHVGDFIFGFVGEIFNFRDFDPHAQCDTQVLGEMWARMGIECLDLFDGFWSIVAWNVKTNVVQIVTDYLAKKPLYMRTDIIAVSSEIKPLVALAPTSDDEFYYSTVAKFGYCPTDHTPFAEIKKIPAGMVMTIDLNNLTSSMYPWVELKPRRTDLRAAIEQSVEARIAADVPIALLVSGGLDSSIIYKLVERRTHNFTVFHVDNNEEEFLDQLQIPGDIPVERLGMWAGCCSVYDALWDNEGPVDLGSLLPQHELSAAIRARCPEVSVVLTGDGADELFGGYRRMKEYDAQYSDIFSELVYYHLPRLDKLSMAHTLELRSPFLSRRVIEGALALPYSDRIEKAYLKSIFADLVPKSILDRPKVPLKSSAVREFPVEWRHKLINKFRTEVAVEYRRRLGA